MRAILWLVLSAVAAVPVANAQVQGCVGKTGLLRIVDDASACKKKETPIELAGAGDAGVPGPAGPAGPAGPPGPQGLPAPENATCRVVARLTIEEMPGEGPNGSIEVLAYSFGVLHDPGGGTGGSGFTTYQPLLVTKEVDGISPELVGAAVEGKVFPKATLDVTDGVGATVLKYKLTEPVFVSLFAGGSTCGVDPTESIGIQFESIELE
jgi:type VI protein secretion system component Hcp